MIGSFDAVILMAAFYFAMATVLTVCFTTWLNGGSPPILFLSYLIVSQLEFLLKIMPAVNET